MSETPQAQPSVTVEVPNVSVVVQERPIKRNKGHNQYTNDWAGMPYPLKYAKAKVLLESGASYSQVRAATGLAPATIARVKRDELDINQSIADVLKKTEGVQLTHLIHGTLDAITAEDIKKASLLQKTTAVCQMIDKRELLEGRPTQRTAFVGKQDNELEAEITALQDKLSGWEDGKIVNTSTLPTENGIVDNQNV